MALKGKLKTAMIEDLEKLEILMVDFYARKIKKAIINPTVHLPK